MPLRETEIRRPGYGTQHLIVIPNGRLNAEQLKALYDSIAEIPQRVPLHHGFPRPGLRGPSRPRSQTQPPEGTPTLEPGNTGTPQPGTTSPTLSPYPEPRKRGEPTDLQLTDPSLPQQLTACASDGSVYGISSTVNAGQTRVYASPRINAAFRVTHIFAKSNTNHNTGPMTLYFKYSEDNDTNGGLQTSGSGLIKTLETGGINIGVQPWQAYPQDTINKRGTYLKMIGVNSDSAAHFVVASISFEFI